MIKFEKEMVTGFEPAVRGMRNPMNSWKLSDSYRDQDRYVIGKDDMKLMKNLRRAGSDHGKFMRMIVVYVDITAPLYWWKEFDTYKVATVSNSCSTMHKIHAKEFTTEDFSIEHLSETYQDSFVVILKLLNLARDNYLESGSKKHWWDMIQLLPSSYNQKRTIELNYETLYNIERSRKGHKLDEWNDFRDWIRTLPYSELITGE